MEFAYKRRGTVSLIAAMGVATGQVLAERIERNESAHFIAFLRQLVAGSWLGRLFSAPATAGRPGLEGDR